MKILVMVVAVLAMVGAGQPPKMAEEASAIQKEVSLKTKIQRCNGKCQAIGTDCKGKVKTSGCADGEQCCTKKSGIKGPIKKVKKCVKGKCQAIGTDCKGRVKRFGCSDNCETKNKFWSCADGKECCMEKSKPKKKSKDGCRGRGECQIIGTKCKGTVKPFGCADGEECCRRGFYTKQKKRCVKGKCQPIGTDCQGRVKPFGCANGKKCCMKSRKLISMKKKGGKKSS